MNNSQKNASGGAQMRSRKRRVVLTTRVKREACCREALSGYGRARFRAVHAAVPSGNEPRAQRPYGGALRRKQGPSTKRFMKHAFLALALAALPVPALAALAPPEQ